MLRVGDALFDRKEFLSGMLFFFLFLFAKSKRVCRRGSAVRISAVFLRVAAAAAIAGAGYTAGAILPAALVHAEPSGGGSDSRTSSSGGTSDKHHVSGGADSDSASKTSQNSQTRAKVGEAGAGGAAPGSSSSKDRASGGPGSPGASKDDKNGPVGAKVGAPNAAREARNEGSSDVAGVGVTAFRKDTPAWAC